jgi:hypothetical protein
MNKIDEQLLEIRYKMDDLDKIFRNKETSLSDFGVEYCKLRNIARELTGDSFFNLQTLLKIKKEYLKEHWK